MIASVPDQSLTDDAIAGALILLGLLILYVVGKILEHHLEEGVTDMEPNIARMMASQNGWPDPDRPRPIVITTPDLAHEGRSLCQVCEEWIDEEFISPRYEDAVICVRCVEEREPGFFDPHPDNAWRYEDL